MLPVAFLTDIEGNLGRLHDFFARHEAFALGADGRHHLRDGWMFVHGGDVPDRFFGSIAVVEELVRLKDETPDRVVLIAGNRDVNKLRLPLELSPGALAAGPQTRADSWEQWVAAQVVADGKRAREEDVVAADRAPYNTRLNRLRWIFKKTMGAADAFELRRQEMIARGEPAGDEQVIDSFLTDLGPGGRFRRLIEHSCLMHRTGNTLYTHAGLTSENYLHVPDVGRVESVDRWVSEMNAWFTRQVAEWRAGVGSWSGTGRRPGEDLILYCQPLPETGRNQASVVYSRNSDLQGKITLPPEPVIRSLASQGIRRVAVGHTPSGDVPVLLRSPDDAFELVVADTSRSVDAARAPLTTIEGGAQDAVAVSATVRLTDGSTVPVAFRARLGHRTPLGKQLPDGAVVVAPVDGGYVTYQLKPGWKLIYTRVPAEDPALPLSSAVG